MAEQWLSIVEYARTFAVSDMTVRRRIKTGRLPAVLREGKYYIPLSAAERFHEESGNVDSLDDPIHTSALTQPQKNVPLAPTLVTPSPASVKPLTASVQEERQDPVLSRLGASFRTLPTQFAQGMQRSEQSLVDTQALLQFCDQSITRINSIERHLQESYQIRLQNVETQLKLKDSVIAQLKQQVEDLQMLVKLMEQNPKALIPNVPASRY